MQCALTDVSYAVKVIDDYHYENHFIDATQKNTPVITVSTENKPAGSGADKEVTDNNSVRSLFVRLVQRLHKDRIRGLRKAEGGECPEARQFCLYEWRDYDGNLQWGSGWYNAKKKFFSASYGENGIRVSIDRVIKWVPMDRIDRI